MCTFSGSKMYKNNEMYKNNIQCIRNVCIFLLSHLSLYSPLVPEIYMVHQHINLTADSTQISIDKKELNLKPSVWYSYRCNEINENVQNLQTPIIRIFALHFHTNLQS
jgi:hypothetical protein